MPHPPNWASVWPPRLDPPVPKNTSVWASLVRGARAARAAAMSSRHSGTRKSGSAPVACTSRKVSRRGWRRSRVRSSSACERPDLPMPASRQPSTDCNSGMGSLLARYLLRPSIRRLADDGGDQAIGLDQPLGHALYVVEAYLLDQVIAAVDIVDAEVLNLDPQELISDAARGFKAERIGPGEIALGVGEFLGVRPLVGKTLKLALDHGKGLGDRLILGGDAPDEHSTILIREEI